MNREEFMAFYRSESYDNELSPDDKVEIFLGALEGSTDITKKLLKELILGYDLEPRRFLKGV